MVQEAAITAFNSLVQIKKDKIELFLFDIFKITSKKFENYIKNKNTNNDNDNNEIFNLFEIFCILTENFPQAFKDWKLSKELINLLFKIWLDNLKMYREYNNNNLYHKNSFDNIANKSLLIIFDMIVCYIKSAELTIVNNFNFLLKIIEDTLEILKINYHYYEKEIFENNFKNKNNNNQAGPLNSLNDQKKSNIFDKEIVRKCFDLLSKIYISAPDFMINYGNKNLIVTYLYKYLELNEKYLNHYLIALIGEIASADKLIFNNNIKYLTNTLINNLDSYHNINALDKDKDFIMRELSICNNSIWAIGVFGISYPQSLTMDVINILIIKLIKIINLPNTNKSISQNVSITIGRIANIYPEIVSKYMEKFLKIFCLSLRNIKESKEKREAFR